MASATDSIIEFFEDLQKPESAAELTKLGMAFAGLVIAAAVIYTASTDPDAKTNNFYLYSVFCILPIVIGVFIISPIFSGPIDINKMYLFGTILFTFMGAMYLFYRIMNPQSVSTITTILTGLCILGVIIGLAIVYRIFIRAIMNSTGWFGLFLKVLFLIPCLLMDLMETVFVELKTTSRMIVALFVLEIVVILAYIYLPRFFKVRPSNAIVLLNKPVFLSTRTIIGKAPQFTMDVNDINNPGKAKDAINTQYSLAMWVFVNQHPNTHVAYSKETNIFRYGTVNGVGGHPRLSYYNNVSSSNARGDTYLLYPTNADPTSIPLNMNAQSWNHVVISYIESRVDVFLNGDLVKSHSLSNSQIPSYQFTDIVEVGYGDNSVTNGGLHGAICNVVYYKKPLTTFEIAADYNLNRYNNPPINDSFSSV